MKLFDFTRFCGQIARTAGFLEVLLWQMFLCCKILLFPRLFAGIWPTRFLDLEELPYADAESAKTEKAEDEYELAIHRVALCQPKHDSDNQRRSSKQH